MTKSTTALGAYTEGRKNSQSLPTQPLPIPPNKSMCPIAQLKGWRDQLSLSGDSKMPINSWKSLLRWLIDGSMNLFIHSVQWQSCARHGDTRCESCSDEVSTKCHWSSSTRASKLHRSKWGGRGWAEKMYQVFLAIQKLRIQQTRKRHVGYPSYFYFLSTWPKLRVFWEEEPQSRKLPLSDCL